MKTIKLSLILVFGLFLITSVVQATIIQTTFGFYNITNNSATNATIGETQLFVDVIKDDAFVNQVLFTFRNIGPAASSITDVYFDDGALLGIAQIINAPAPMVVAFSQYASPSNLPGGNDVGFKTTAGFSADSDPPVQPKGVNPGEWVTIVFDLKSEKTYGDVLNSLALGYSAEDSLGIGVRVQGFADGGSESFINNTEPVPEPGTLLLMGSGLVGIAGYARLRFGRKKK